jgi:hypothetical protein
MTVHKTDRNIVNASAMHQALDISFGPSDDDFHYKRHHATISHENAVVDANHIDIKLIFQGGGCEIQWATGDHAHDEYKWDGFANVSHDGKLSFPFNTKDGVPFWVVFDSDGLRVYTYEGEPPEAEYDQWQVFNSATIK